MGGRRVAPSFWLSWPLKTKTCAPPHPQAKVVAGDEAVGRSFVDAFEDTPVVLMAAAAGHADVLRAVKMGAVDFLDKPLSLLKLKNIWQHSVRKVRRVGGWVVGTWLLQSELGFQRGRMHSWRAAGPPRALATPCNCCSTPPTLGPTPPFDYADDAQGSWPAPGPQPELRPLCRRRRRRPRRAGRHPACGGPRASLGRRAERLDGGQRALGCRHLGASAFGQHGP